MATRAGEIVRWPDELFLVSADDAGCVGVGVRTRSPRDEPSGDTDGAPGDGGGRDGGGRLRHGDVGGMIVVHMYHLVGTYQLCIQLYLSTMAAKRRKSFFSSFESVQVVYGDALDPTLGYFFSSVHDAIR